MKKIFLPTYLPTLFSCVCNPKHIFLGFSLIFFWGLVNETFSNFKLNIFFITGFICSNKEVKQKVLINHISTSPTIQRGWGLQLCLFSKKWGRIYVSTKKGEVGVTEQEWRLLRESNLWLLLVFVFIDPRNITIPGIFIRVISFNIYPNRFYVKSKF